MIDIYKLKFTILQQEIISFLIIKAGMSFNARSIARQLKVSQTAISKSLPLLEKEKIVKIKKDKDSGRLSIELNRDNKKVINLKRVENLKILYESEIVEFLLNIFPASTIILFGSYSFGEDTINSDIDIAVVGYKQKNINLSKFEQRLERPILIHFYLSFKEINKNLKENILNGIVLKGGVEL